MPYIMRKLFEADSFAVSLAMPNPKKPVVSEWIQKIKNEVGEPKLEKYLIGHSLGVPAILRYLENMPVGSKIGGAFLVSGPCKKLDVQNPDSHFRLIDNFLEGPFNFAHIKKVCDRFYIIHGENDPHVPFSHAEFFGKELGAPITKIYRGGHLGDKDIYEFPELLEIILQQNK